MMRLNTAILAAVVLAAVLLFVFPTSSVSAETVKIIYKGDSGVKVDFIDGDEIERGTDLIIEVSSQEYDMTKARVQLFEIETGPDGAVYRKGPGPEGSLASDGSKVTYTFKSVNTDVELAFDLPPPLGPKENNDEGSEAAEGGNVPIDNATIVIAAAISLAAVMLVLMMNIMRRIDSIEKEIGDAK